MSCWSPITSTANDGSASAASASSAAIGSASPATSTISTRGEADRRSTAAAACTPPRVISNRLQPASASPSRKVVSVPPSVTKASSAPASSRDPPSDTLKAYGVPSGISTAPRLTTAQHPALAPPRSG